MTAKKIKNMSVAVDAEFRDLVDVSAKMCDLSRSELVRKVVEKHLDLVVNDGTNIPVILKIPAKLKGNPEAVNKWLQVKVAVIVQALS